jgi:hypothetical protein
LRTLDLCFLSLPSYAQWSGFSDASLRHYLVSPVIGLLPEGVVIANKKVRDGKAKIGVLLAHVHIYIYIYIYTLQLVVALFTHILV